MIWKFKLYLFPLYIFFSIPHPLKENFHLSKNQLTSKKENIISQLCIIIDGKTTKRFENKGK